MPCTCCGPPVIFSKTPKFCCLDLTDCFGQQAWQYIAAQYIRTLYVGRRHDGNETRESRHTSDAIIRVATMASASASRHSTPEAEACTRPCSVPEHEQKHHPASDANVDPLPPVYQPPDPEPPHPHETHPLPPPDLIPNPIPNPNPNSNPNPSQVWAAPANCYGVKTCICCCSPCYQCIAAPIIPGEPARPRARPSPSPHSPASP